MGTLTPVLLYRYRAEKSPGGGQGLFSSYAYSTAAPLGRASTKLNRQRSAVSG